MGAGRAERAWKLFIEQYHRLIGATIRRLVADPDDALDIFAIVCERLTENDFARLRRFHDEPGHRAKCSTWLVVVVRNLCIDWHRAREGRPRAAPPPGLTPLRERIYELVLVGKRSHTEAYELLREREATGLGFGEFLREVRASYQAVDARRWSYLALLHGELADGERAPGSIAGESESDDRIARAMEKLSPSEREAVRMFVVEGRSAVDVALAVGWPNAKAVYNRVHRALASMRATLGSREGDRQ